MSTPAADPIGGLAGMLAHPFMQHALLAGTAIAALSGLVGYFVVLRGQVFAGDMLSHVAYTGSLGALVAGLDARAGLFAATILVALGLGALGGRAAADDVLIGNAMAWMLGLGVFFLALYSTYAAAGNSQANVNVLFGSIFGISATAAVVAALIALALIVALLIIATAVRQPRPGGRRRRRGSRAAARPAVFGHPRRRGQRSQPSRRGAAAGGAHRRARGGRHPNHRPPLACAGVVRDPGHRRDVVRARPGLRRSGTAPQLHHHGHRRVRIRPGRRGHQALAATRPAPPRRHGRDGWESRWAHLASHRPLGGATEAKPLALTHRAPGSSTRTPRPDARRAAEQSPHPARRAAHLDGAQQLGRQPRRLAPPTTTNNRPRAPATPPRTSGLSTASTRRPATTSMGTDLGLAVGDQTSPEARDRAVRRSAVPRLAPGRARVHRAAWLITVSRRAGAWRWAPR